MTSPLSVSTIPSSDRRALLGGALLLAALLVAPARAGAAKKVAVDLEGGAAKAEKAVVRALGDEGFDVVGTAAWKKAAKKAKGRGEQQIARAAKRLGVAAVVVGKVQKKGKKQLLVLTVHNGKDGVVLETVAIAMKGGKASTSDVAAELGPVIRRGQAARRGGEEPAAPPEQPEQPEAGPPAEPTEKPEPTATPAPPAETPKPAAPDGAAGRPAFGVNLGASFWARRMSVTPDQSADVYNGKPVPGLRVDGAIYPAAFFMKDSIVADFGVGFLLDMVWLSSELQGGGAKLATTQTHWGVDARWRHRFGDSGTSPTLLVAFTVENLGFKIGDRTAAPADLNIPDISYLGFGPKVGLVLPLGTPSFRAGTTVSYLITNATETNALPGRGLDGTWGIDWALHFDYLPFPWLLTRAQFGLTRFSTSYVPTAGQTITGMADMYIGGLITAGYVFQ